KFQCPSSQFTCKNSRCIPSSWRCDKDSDCNDGEPGGIGSDEIDCAVTCSDEDQFRCDNGQCISSRWQCDRDTDCRDGSDEKPEFCANKTCKEDQFQCGNGACIPRAWMCDGQTDCADDEADEKNEECTKVTCKEGEFACKNGRCIEERWMCDQDDDCYDKSDEDPKLCPVQSCETDEFQCENKLCVKSSWVCDGDLDCKDGSDEKNCSDTALIGSKCSKTEFVCNGTFECIHMSWRCDGDADCTDESDEHDCVITCRSDQFMCVEESYCISDVLKCDGNPDCNDNSDEEGCPTQCKKNEFDCQGNGKKCIPMHKVCNHQNDCGMFEDEDPERFNFDPCEDKNNRCNQVCVNDYQGGYICQCHKGFKLNTTTECIDINECETPGTCSQLCTNTKGSFKCSCEEGYMLDENKHCRVDGKGPQLLLANRKDLRRIDIADQRKFDYSLLVKDASVECAIAVDYDIRNNKVYWTDVSMEKILSADIDDNTTVTTVADTFVNTPDGIAVDWIHKHLYWTDTGYNKIEVSTLDGKMRRVLIDSDLDEPRAIVLDPSNGYMYWTDWGENPKIEKCGMDGSNRQVIIQNKPKQNIVIEWPNGITIDYVNERLLWLDAKLHKIVSSDYEGNDLRLVHSSHADVHHPYGIAVFEDFIYYTDWKSESVRKMNKFGIGKPTVVALDLNEPTDVHIFHEYKQPQWSNRCPADHGCQHFCLPSPSDVKYSCVCQNDFNLNIDKKTCSEIRKQSLPTEKSQFCLFSHVIFSIFQILFVFFKRLRRKNIKSMNFDNPVYRKTTEEQFAIDKANKLPPVSLYLVFLILLIIASSAYSGS
ncbi:hypothetical protein LOTGIDRAFT_112161, partial [Lottia gigantea]